MKKNGSLQGYLLFGFFIVGIVISAWYIIAKGVSFPPLASEHGRVIDQLFNTTLLITGVAFLITQFLLVYFALRYRKNDENTQAKAYWYPDNKKLEIIWTVVPAIIFTALIIFGQVGWGNIFGDAPEDSFVVEITGEQFAWNVRYPGSDGEFGRTDPSLISRLNPLGIDSNDPAAHDDVVLLNEIRLPVNTPVLLLIRSKDVLHSVYLPNFRVKMDAVPGITTTFWFVPTEVGEFELACAELCGLGHYRMRGYVTVQTMEEIEEWLSNQETVASL